MIGPDDIEPAPPIAGESLDGYVARVVALNEVDKVARVARWGGLQHGHRPNLATTGWDGLPELAKVLGVDVEELRSRSYPIVGDGSRRAFFGTEVYRADIQTRSRRFSPAALAKSPHHRALWNLRLPFDVETGELLVSTCPRPGCGKVQRWRNALGIDCCDDCVMDLTTTPAGRVPDHLLPDLARGVGLIHPDRAKRSASLDELPPAVRDLGSADAFELLLRLAPVAEPMLRWSGVSRLWNNDPQAIAAGMAGAWKVLTGWPGSFHSLASERVARAATRFDDGSDGATLRFLALGTARGLSAPVAAVIRSLRAELDLDGPDAGPLAAGALPPKAASKTLGLGTQPLTDLRRRGAFRTIAVLQRNRMVGFYDGAEVERVRRDIERRADLSSGTEIFGVPLYGLEQAATMGVVPLLTHPFFRLRYDEPQTTREALDDLKRRLMDGASTDLADAVPLSSALHVVGGRPKSWDTILVALLDGRLPYSVATNTRGRIRLAARPADVLPFAMLCCDLTDQPSGLSGQMSRRDAGEYLNLGPKETTDLFRELGNGVSRVVPAADVERLSRAYIAAVEIAARSGLSVQQVYSAARKEGLVRLSPAGFDRGAAEAALL